MQSFPQSPFEGPVPESFCGVTPEDDDEEEEEEDDVPTTPDDDDVAAAPPSPSLPAFQL